MEEQRHYFKISPENIIGDIFQVTYVDGVDVKSIIDPCCSTTAFTSTTITGITGVYSGMSQVLSGGTNGNSLLTGLTVPIVLTQVATDIGYYSLFDGAILQKDVITNFVFSGLTGTPYTYFVLNSSDTEFKKFLSLTTFTIDWGDGTALQTITGNLPISHTYPLTSQTYQITLKANSPWGISTVTKTITIPYTNVTISNPNGTATFQPAGGSWSATSFSYDYIYTGDSNTNINDYYSSNYTTVPFLVTGYTQSQVNDLKQYGPASSLYASKFKVGVPVTGSSGTIGVFWGPDPTGSYTAYTINNIDYYDYVDGTTIFIVSSSGYTSDNIILSAITKNEALLNVIDEAEILSSVFVERGKNSAYESVQRLGEVDTLGDLQKYGYGFFNIEKQ